MSLLCIIALVIAIVFGVKSHKERKAGIPFKKELIICVIAAILCVLFAEVTVGTSEDSNESSSEITSENTEIETDAVDSEVAEVNDDSETNSESEDYLTIEIIAGELGDYGQELILNEDTDMPDKTIGYFIPVGTYKVTNIGEHMNQANVYKNERNVTDEGWEEWADAKAKVIDVNESVEMTIEDGWFFNCDEPSHFILEKID